MFEINSYVMYGDNGVCKITEKKRMKFGGQYKNYYVLKPVHNSSSTLYVPTDNEELLSKMRDVLTKEEVVELIKSVKDGEISWVEDNKERSALYDSIFETGDRMELMLLIKSLYRHKQERQEQGKKLWTIDENAMKHAEKLVYDEFATALDMDVDQVVPFIMEVVENS